MAHDVFISYSSHDKVIADAICSKLENNKIRCWIAPRDIIPGDTYGKSIIEAMNGCKIVVIVFSSHSNASNQVISEIERAVSKSKIIIPFRIENITPSDDMELFLGRRHWLDALTPPLEIHISKLSDTINRLLPAQDKIPEPEPKPAPSPVPSPEPDKGSDIKTKISDLHINKKPTSDSQKKLEELTVILSDLLEQHSFDKAFSIIPEILAIDRDNIDALNAQALIDKRDGFGKFKNFTGPGVAINAFFPQDGHIIVAGFGGISGKSSSAKPPTVFIWDVDSEKKLFEFSFKRPWRPTCFTFSPDIQTFLIGDLRSIYLISVEKKRIIADYEAAWIQCVSFLPEGNKAITAGNELLSWDFDLESVIYRFKGHIGRIQSLAITPDGKKAVTGGEDATIRLWDLQKKHEIWCIEGFKVNFQSVAISSDGRQILAGGNNIIHLIDLNTGNKTLSFAGHNGYTLSIAFSPAVNRAISGGTDNIVRVWDLNNGQQIRGYRVSGSWTGSVGYSRDGRFAISSDIGNVTLWTLPE
jgi:WD40 repeat protein